MTPQQAYDLLEALPPVVIKNALLTAFAWQAAHGKRLVHVGFYLRTAWYTERPRPKPIPPAIQALTAGIGRAA